MTIGEHVVPEVKTQMTTGVVFKYKHGLQSIHLDEQINIFIKTKS